jgi:anti-sigma factor RsiW
MNDLHHPCENLAERISLAAAGCLSPDEQQEVRRHIETCSDCRERFGQLTQLCGALAELRLPAEIAETAIVERVMSAVASGEADIPDSSQAETTRPTFLTQSLTTWRWIMSSPVSRIAIAAIFVLAVTGVALWFHAGGTTPAFAEFLEPILNPKTVRYKETAKWTSLSAEMKSQLSAEVQQNMMKGLTDEVMMLDAYRSRTVSEGLDKNSKMVHIWDGYKGKTLDLLPTQKRASVFKDDNTPKEKTPNGGDPVAGWRAMLLDARDKPGVKAESLGEKEIDGRRVIGFRINLPEAVFCVWGDPKTGLPARLEMTTKIMPNMEFTISDFEFNVDMDESLFSVEPPAGYEVGSFFISTPTIDGSKTKEKDLIETFRQYSKMSGGSFPAFLNYETISGIVMMEFTQDRMQESGAEKELAEIQAKLQPGLMFSLLLPKEADAHYAGKGVSLDAADTPIFWYRPKDAKAYRVIYADLSVRDADTPPVMPIAQPEKDLIETLCSYSELSGGPFPAKLDFMSLIQGAAMKIYTPPEDGQNPTAKQSREITKTAMLKLQPGLSFVTSLPPEADVHYAGKGVSLGAADTPIFWYCPKDSNMYRVIYADLSVRDADTPPIMPYVQPEKDLIDTFREYCELSGGPFPPKLNLMSLIQAASIKFVIKYPPEDGQKPSAKSLQGMAKSTTKFQPGLDFTASLPPEADAHYAGKGVSLGAPDTPIFWYKPKDANKYRIIYADLSVRDADTPPSAPVVQPEEDLIDTFRYYCKLSGGPFPDSLESGGTSWIVEKKLGLEKGQEPNEKQMKELMKSQPRLMQEVMEISMNFQPGSTFIKELPPEADAHYAGKGVSLGAPDTPIFWYRPKDSKKYRVIYADLSIREADTPPNVPDAQPVPAPSTPKE